LKALIVVSLLSKDERAVPDADRARAAQWESVASALVVDDSAAPLVQRRVA